MAKMKLNLESLNQLGNGVLSVAFERDMAWCIRDCVDRASDERPRKLVLEVAIVPDAEEDGVCSDVSMEFEIRSSIPSRRSRKYNVAVSANGAAMINPLSPGGANQGTLDELVGEAESMGAKGKK